MNVSNYKPIDSAKTTDEFRAKISDLDATLTSKTFLLKTDGTKESRFIRFLKNLLIFWNNSDVEFINVARSIKEYVEESFANLNQKLEVQDYKKVNDLLNKLSVKAKKNKKKSVQNLMDQLVLNNTHLQADRFSRMTIQDFTKNIVTKIFDIPLLEEIFASISNDFFDKFINANKNDLKSILPFVEIALQTRSDIPQKTRETIAELLLTSPFDSIKDYVNHSFITQDFVKGFSKELLEDLQGLFVNKKIALETSHSILLQKNEELVEQYLEVLNPVEELISAINEEEEDDNKTLNIVKEQIKQVQDIIDKNNNSPLVPFLKMKLDILNAQQEAHLFYINYVKNVIVAE